MSARDCPYSPTRGHTVIEDKADHKTAPTVNGIRRWVKSVGWLGTMAWAVCQTKAALGLNRHSTIKIKPKQAKYPVIARLGGSSDINVFRQVFLDDEYSSARNIPSPSLILDLGANVGYSSIYFLSLFPTATVVAVEPDPANFEMCLRNLAPYGDRAKVILGAVWSKRSRLVLSRESFGDGREWSVQVRESNSEEEAGTVDGWDVPSLLQLAGKNHVDLLKVDIERSELEVFGGNPSPWLREVGNICIELHGDDCRETFLNALKDFEYDLGTSGELTTSWNMRPKTA